MVNVRRFIDCEKVKGRQVLLADDKLLVSTLFKHDKLMHDKFLNCQCNF